MITTLVAWGARTPLPELAVMLAWDRSPGARSGSSCSCPRSFVSCPIFVGSSGITEHVRTTELRSGVRQPRRRANQRAIDALLASLLPTGAVTGLANAQLLYTLPVSLFGMSISAAELPEMSGDAGLDAIDRLRNRLNAGLRQIAFFVVPSAVAFFALGDVIAAALLQTGRFTHDDAVYVWGILAGSAVGLLASTLGRLYSSTYYALRDTRTPLLYAIIRVVLTTVLGYVSRLCCHRDLGSEPYGGRRASPPRPERPAGSSFSCCAGA